MQFMTEKRPSKPQPENNQSSKFPEVLKNSDQKIIILNLHNDLTNASKKYDVRLLIGNALGVFESSYDASKRISFDKNIFQEMLITERTIEYGRAKILQLPKDLYRLTKEPTEHAWGRTAVQDLPASEAIRALGVSKDECRNKEVVIVPPSQENLEKYVKATEDLLDKTPHVAFLHSIYYGGSTWKVREYQPGMENTMEHVVGAI